MCLTRWIIWPRVTLCEKLTLVVNQHEKLNLRIGMYAFKCSELVSVFACRFYDTSKQGVGALVIHFANVFLAEFFQGDPCTWWVHSLPRFGRSSFRKRRTWYRSVASRDEFGDGVNAVLLMILQENHDSLWKHLLEVVFLKCPHDCRSVSNHCDVRSVEVMMELFWVAS